MNEELPRLGLVRRYLSAYGWRRQSLEINELDLFSLPELPGIEVILPSDPQIQSTSDRIKQAVRTLADLADVSFDTMQRTIKGIGFDLVQAALPASKVFRQSIKLKIAESFLRSSRNIIMHAATAEYETVNLEDASRSGTEYADDCQFGHTFHGSFGFQILSPIGPNPNSTAYEDIPMERRIILRLEHGLTAVERAQKASDPNILVRDAVLGLNANGYDSVARLLERAEANEVTFAFHLSPEWKSLRTSDVDKHIRLASSSVGLLREASRALRKEEYELPEVTVIGRVVRLFSKNIPTYLINPGGREIAVQWESAEYGDVLVRVRLTPERYLEAIYAHEQGLDLKIRGLLEPYAGGFRFVNVLSFEIL